MIEAMINDIAKLISIGTGKRTSFSEKLTINILNILYHIFYVLPMVKNFKFIRMSCHDK